MAESDALFAPDELPELQAAPSQSPYLVLARKYRPATFGELIGQDAVVRTLSNAIARDRLAHAYLLTGVRGVGKTSTARLLAKSLNCIGPDGQGGATIDACGVCTHCVAIAAGRDIDVVEMDAASHTGVDDVREIIEAAKYSAVAARYKIYIVDEVHMLSRQAFNALLKTLEEPPAHVKFVFATTEVDKLPVTVLSRCQRFDLRRIPTARLADHFADIVRREGVEAEGDALALVARAAEGSVRDGLSILDQAIANASVDGDGAVTADQVRAMLGLADGAALRDLMAAVLAGDAAALLAEVDRQHEGGADPQSMVVGLLGLVHAIARHQAGGEADAALAPDDRERLADWAGRLAPPVLHRLWQMLLRASEETASAPLPREAAEMGLLRALHAADLPDPSDLARLLAERGGEGSEVPALPAASPASAPPVPEPMEAGAPEPVAAPADYAALYDDVHERVGAELSLAMLERVRVVRYAPPELVLAADQAKLASEMQRALRGATDVRWVVSAGEGEGQPTLLSARSRAAEQEQDALRADPMIQAAFDAFPDAVILPQQKAA